jgi:hypothetical protein
MTSVIDTPGMTVGDDLQVGLTIGDHIDNEHGAFASTTGDSDDNDREDEELDIEEFDDDDFDDEFDDDFEAEDEGEYDVVEEFEDDFTFVDPATKKPVTHATETEGADIESGDDDSDDAEGTSQIPGGEEELDSEPAENADNIEADAE